MSKQKAITKALVERALDLSCRVKLLQANSLKDIAAWIELAEECEALATEVRKEFGTRPSFIAIARMLDASGHELRLAERAELNRMIGVTE